MVDAEESILCKTFWFLYRMGGVVIKYTWMVLYTTSTASVTNNELFITDVHQCLAYSIITVLANGGSQVFY